MAKNKESLNILISSAGRRVALVKAFRKALTSLSMTGRVVAIDISRTAPALYEADSAHVVPRVDDEEFLPALCSIVEQEKIGLVIPTIDPELPLYSRQYERFRDELGITVAVSSPEVVETCTDKRAFYCFLKSIGVPTPRTVNGLDILKGIEIEAELEFPLFVKPRSGFASVHVFKVEDEEELRFLIRKYPDLIVQQYIRGTEYTVDLLSDLEGTVLSIVPRQRIEVRAGEVTRSRTEKNSAIIEYSGKIAEALGSRGPITLQCLLSEGIPYFFEVNPRVGGGLPASIAAGANTPRMLIRMACGHRVRPSVGRFRENHYMLRYDDAVYRTELLPGGIDIWREK
jgi:carbamoyl-phosphate synthase large subunit